MAIRPLSFGSIPTVTSLPVDPVDTAEVDLVVDDPGTYGGPYLWRCKYRAATAGSYKWHVLTEQPLINVQTAIPTAITAVAYTTLSTNVTITLPFAGDWDITCFCKECWYNGASGGYGRASYSVGATAATDFDGPVQYFSGTGTTNGLGESTVTRRKVGLASGTVLTMQAKVATTGTFYPNNATVGMPYGLFAKPVRIT